MISDKKLNVHVLVVSKLTQEELELVGGKEDRVNDECDNAGLRISATKSNHEFT